MFCKNCGSNLKDGSTFCHNCGSMINDQTAKSAPATTLLNGAPMPEATQNAAPIYQEVPVQSVPVQSVPVQNAPMQNVPMQSVPIQNVPVQNIPVQNVPMQNAPMQYPQNVQPYGYVPYPIAEAPKKKLSAFDILSLVFGIVGISMEALGILFAPAALIFGIIARKKSKSGMALAGIILGSIGTALSILAIIMGIVFSDSILDSFNFFDDGLYF